MFNLMTRECVGQLVFGRDDWKGRICDRRKKLFECLSRYTTVMMEVDLQHTKLLLDGTDSVIFPGCLGKHSPYWEFAELETLAIEHRALLGKMTSLNGRRFNHMFMIAYRYLLNLVNLFRVSPDVSSSTDCNKLQRILLDCFEVFSF